MISESSVVAQYLGSCFSGALAASECGAVWQFTVIGVLVLAGIAALVGLRVRAGKERQR